MNGNPPNSKRLIQGGEGGKGTGKEEDADRGAGSQREVMTYLPLAESPQKETESLFS